MSLLEFMSENTLLTIILAVLIFLSVENIVTRFTEALIERKLEVQEKENIEEDHY